MWPMGHVLVVELGGKGVKDKRGDRRWLAIDCANSSLYCPYSVLFSFSHVADFLLSYLHHRLDWACVLNSLASVVM